MSYPRPPASSWGLAFFLSFIVVLWLLLGTQPANGQSENPSAPQSLSGNLEQAEMNLRQLMTRLGERQRQVNDLQANLQTADERLNDLAASLATLRGQLEAAQESLATSRTALSETSTSLDALSKQYDALDKAWLNYRSEMAKQVLGLEREVKRAKAFAWVFGVGTAAGAIACLVMALIK